MEVLTHEAVAVASELAANAAGHPFGHLTRRNWGWWPTPLGGGKVVYATLPAVNPPPATGAPAHPEPRSHPAPCDDDPTLTPGEVARICRVEPKTEWSNGFLRR